MSLRIIPIGVNGAFTVHGGNTNLLVELDGHRLLIDCGATAHRSSALLGIDFRAIDSVYISHLHLDHVGGLFDLGYMRFFAGLPRPRIALAEPLASPLWENLLRPMMEFVVDRDGKGRRMRCEDYFDIVPLPITAKVPSDVFKLGDGIPVRLVPVPHVAGMICHGLVVADRAFLTTDMTFQPDLLDRLANQFGLEAIIHDCSFTPSHAPVHATAEQLKTLPSDLRQLLTLVHYEDHISPEQDEIDCPLGIAGQAIDVG